MSSTSLRYEEAVNEAIAMRPAVIVAPSTASARAVRQRNLLIPVVFTSFSDPVRAEIVTSTFRRSEPFTGVWMADELDAKRLEILHDAYPDLKSIAVVVDTIWDNDARSRLRLPDWGRRLGLSVKVLLAENRSDVERLLDDEASRQFDAWCLPPSGLSSLNSEFIVERLRQWGKPVIVGRTLAAANGAPLSYGYDPGFRWPAMVNLLSRVLRGEPAGTIPIQRPSRTVLAVSLAPASGFPAAGPSVIQRADQVIR